MVLDKDTAKKLQSFLPYKIMQLSWNLKIHLHGLQVENSKFYWRNRNNPSSYPKHLENYVSGNKWESK